MMSTDATANPNTGFVSRIPIRAAGTGITTRKNPDSSPWADFPTGQTDMDGGEGHGPYTYHILPEHLLKVELDRHASAKKIGTADCVSMQPCMVAGEESQDRYTVQEWDMKGGNWWFAAIFDGRSQSGVSKIFNTS